MWKFQDFSVTQILREIIFGESRSYESATFSNCKGSELYLFGGKSSKSTKIHKNQNSEPLNALK